jgi:hypothetical protein
MTEQQLKDKKYFAPERHMVDDCRDFDYTGQCANPLHYDLDEAEPYEE